MFEPFWMRAALLAHAKSSIESLRITSSQRSECEEVMGTFRDFTALRELETDIHLLVSKGHFHKLAELLPDSVEKAFLHTGDHLCCDSVVPLLKAFERTKSQRLLNLRALKLSSKPKMGTTQMGKDLMKTLEDACRDVGIEVTFIAG